MNKDLKIKKAIMIGVGIVGLAVTIMIQREYWATISTLFLGLFLLGFFVLILGGIVLQTKYSIRYVISFSAGLPILAYILLRVFPIRVG